MPKWWKSAGETTSTSTPRARSAATASPTKCPAGSPGWRGYEVVRTATRTPPLSRPTIGRMDDFVPRDFDVPGRLESPQFVLEPLGAEHNEQDYEAWTSSMEH